MPNSIKNAFFSKQSVLNTSKKSNTDALKQRVELKRWDIIEFIKNNPNSTCYKISKETKTNYSQMFQIIRELLFCRLILKTKIKGANGEIYSAYYIPNKSGGYKNE